MKIKSTFCLFLIMLSIAFAQDGVLDTTFGNNGTVFTDVSNNSKHDVAYAVTVNDEGKIIVAGYTYNQMDRRDFAIAQYNSDGTLDNAFGNNGIAHLALNNSDKVAMDMALQSDGKIVIVGYVGTPKNILVTRLLQNGSIDTTFGSIGTYMYDSGANERANKLTISSSDEIFIGCEIQGDYGVLKLNASGNIMTSFGNNGIVTTNVSPADYLNDIVLQPDGKILITGNGENSNTSNNDEKDLVLMRYNADGSLDTSFNQTGIVFESLIEGSSDEGFSILIQDDNKIVVTAVKYAGYEGDFALVRYNEDGSRDLQFGDNGVSIANNFNHEGKAFASLLQNDGKIIVGGYLYNASADDQDFALIRFDTEGDVDTSFGSNGLIMTDINNGSYDGGYALTFDENHQVIMAGDKINVSNNFHLDFALARYIIEDNLSTNNELIYANNFTLYPNPTTDYVTLINNSDIEKTDIQVISSSGKLIKDMKDYTFNNAISLRDLPSGVYYLRILNDKATETIKFIKK